MWGSSKEMWPLWVPVYHRGPSSLPACPSRAGHTDWLSAGARIWPHWKEEGKVSAHVARSSWQGDEPRLSTPRGLGGCATLGAELRFQTSCPLSGGQGVGNAGSPSYPCTYHWLAPCRLGAPGQWLFVGAGLQAPCRHPQHPFRSHTKSAAKPDPSEQGQEPSLSSASHIFSSRPLALAVRCQDAATPQSCRAGPSAWEEVRLQMGMQAVDAGCGGGAAFAAGSRLLAFGFR